jgi:hypothetical protein
MARIWQSLLLACYWLQLSALLLLRRATAWLASSRAAVEATLTGARNMCKHYDSSVTTFKLQQTALCAFVQVLHSLRMELLQASSATNV